MIETNVPFIDAMTIKYECPRCGHPQKQYFKFKKVGDEIEFACQDCGFKNAAKLTDSEGEDDGKK